MKAIPIDNGGLCLEMEDADDWKLLARMLLDARDPEFDLAEDLGGQVTDEAVAGDWREFVVPDLRVSFDDGLERVAKAIHRAHQDSAGGAGLVLIPRDAGAEWYGALNNARLALEARHKFGRDSHDRPRPQVVAGFSSEKRAAFLRERLYCALQCALLEHAFE